MLVVKNQPANAGDIRHANLLRGSERCLGEGNDNWLQYSCLENSMGREAWWEALVYRAAESDTTEQMHTYTRVHTHTHTQTHTDHMILKDIH